MTADTLTADEMKAILDRLDEDTRRAMIEVAKAERWAQVPDGTTSHLLRVLSGLAGVGA